MIRYITILFFTLFIRDVYAQNVVPNGDFESYTKYPFVSTYGFFKGYINDWKSANTGSPDYYSLHSRPSYYANEQSIERELPHKGNGFVGLALLDEDYHEYIQIKLNKTLLKDELYCFTAYVTARENITLHRDKLEFLFSKKPVYKLTKRAIKINKNGQNRIETYLTNDTMWVPIVTTFIPSDSLRYLTIGNFEDSSKIASYTNAYYKTQPDQYYYLDDISVVKIKNEADCVCKQDTVKNKGVKNAEKKTVTQLYFKFNEAVIKPYNYKTLDSVYNKLITHPRANLLVNGYTDNVGKEISNVVLSAARAKSVATYFVNKGIASTRITCKEYGSSNALNDNSTENLRIKNRRTELIVTY